MQITEIRVSLHDDDKLKAFATITLDNAFVVRGLKIIQGHTGAFVAMPSRKRADGEYQDIAHPINNETRETMERVILAEYERERERGQQLIAEAEEASGPEAGEGVSAV